MGISLNWLKEYIDLDWPGDELAERLTMAGIAFEGAVPDGDDWIMESDLTPNRGDCQGYINLAREVSALNGRPLKLPGIKMEQNQEDINEYIKVSIDEPRLCRRYAARLIKNIKLGPSPAWMQERLLKSGIRPISNVVDITNYVMLECNQPLHAFDYRLLGPEKHIIVRRALPGELFTTLDDVERQLDEDMLLITEGGRAVALAGIMGGQNTEINEQTVDVLLESAHFDGICIRRTSRRLALRSDSSVRFGKGTDVEGVIFAADRAAALLQELAGGEIVGGICDCYPGRREPVELRLRPARVNQVLGTDLSPARVRACLEALNLNPRDDKGDLLVTVPAYRPDISIEADLIEEVARLYGYDNIPATLPEGPTTPGVLTPVQKLRDRVKSLLSPYMYEIVAYSFISPDWHDLMMLPEDSPLRKGIRVANPLSEEQSVMRTFLLPGLLDTVARNQARQNDSMAFFEMGTVFFASEGPLAHEKLKLGGIATGSTTASWTKNALEMDFFYIKGIIEKLLFELGIDEYRFTASQCLCYHPGRTALLTAGGHEIGILGEVHPQVQECFKIKSRCTAFELDMESLFALSRTRRMEKPISRYPSVDRDIAVIVPDGTPAALMLDIIRSSGGECLREVKVADVYSGVQIPAGMKSVAFQMSFQASDGTLSEAQVNPLMDALLAGLEKEAGARLRG